MLLPCSKSFNGFPFHTTKSKIFTMVYGIWTLTVSSRHGVPSTHKVPVSLVYQCSRFPLVIPFAHVVHLLERFPSHSPHSRLSSLELISVNRKCSFLSDTVSNTLANIDPSLIFFSIISFDCVFFYLPSQVGSSWKQNDVCFSKCSVPNASLSIWLPLVVTKLWLTDSDTCTAAQSIKRSLRNVYQMLTICQELVTCSARIITFIFTKTTWGKYCCFSNNSTVK